MMPGKVHVFYAWQSDTPAALNHRFIRDAAQQAIDKLKADAELDEADAFDRLELDHDTKDVPGSPNVAETICRKIDACTLFIGDVTTVGEYARRSDGAVKKTANANVLIELGYARRAKGVERIVTVQNRAFGSPDDLPFDLKHLRHPIQYTLADDADPEFVRKRSELAGQFKVAFRAILTSDSFTAGSDAERRAVTAEAAAARQRAGEERAAFEDRVPKLSFFGFGAVRGIFALSVIPIDPQPRLDLVALGRKKPVKDFRPLQTSEWAHAPYGRSLVAHYDEPNWISGRLGAITVAELTDSGRVFAADAFLRVNFAPHLLHELVNMPMEAYEPDMLRSLADYVRTVRAIGVKGPLQVGLTVMRVQNVRLLPVDRPAAYPDARPFAADKYSAQPVIVGEDAEAGVDAAVARAVRPALDELWRECGFTADPFFDRKSGEHAGLAARKR